MAAKALDFASERLSQVQTVQVFAQEERETGAFRDLSACGYDMAQRYAFFQVHQMCCPTLPHTPACRPAT